MPVEAPIVILVHPQLGENIGAAARAMANFALSELRLVKPRDGWPNPQAKANASGADWVIDGAKLYDTVEEAIGDLDYVLATTARRRDMIKPVLAPEEAARAAQGRIAAGGRVGVLFGPERTGLESDHVALADAIVMAPVNPAFASLNLAQAVLLVGYEWFKQAGEQGLGRATPVDPSGEQGTPMSETRLATKAELLNFFTRLEAALTRSGFLYPPEKAPIMVRNLRNLFARAGLTEREVRTLHGIVSSLARQRFEPGEPQDD
ncbi:RNA methyltransferase [Rhodoligotrophos defluvii]|uniref:RNA methyltransferase n=1 Tax=Rhodoligotrophos defluvii TaxID=2561934 RepID=UPI0010CA0E42|nr:RNA methyltransferase [Rhodoligotrophos defluvii]